MKLQLVFLFLLVAAASPLLGQTVSSENGGPYLSAEATADAFSFSWWGVSGRTYFIEQSLALNDWDYATIIESGQDAVIQWDFTSNAERSFLRLHPTDIPMVDPFDADIDGDGVSNWQELLAGTDPFQADSDADMNGNGLSNVADLLAETNPNAGTPAPGFVVTGLVVFTPLEGTQ